MRVGLNLLYLIPDVVGGTETYARTTMSRLFRRSDIDFVLFVNREFTAPFSMPPHVRLVTVEFDARNRGIRYLVEQTVLPRLASECRLDLLHSMGYVSVLACPCPTVVTIHDLNYRHISMPWHRRLPLQWFVRESARRSAAIVTGSEFSKREICSELRVRADRVWVIHNAPMDDVAFVEPLPLSARAPQILALSSPSAHKNIGRLIRAFARVAPRHPGVKLVVAGLLSRDVAVPLSLEGRMEVRGYLDRSSLVDLYRRSHAFFMPSLYEGFGMPVVEAMAFGTPVACSNRAALPEIAGGAALLFDATDEAQMEAALIRLLSDHDEWRRLSAAGRVRARAFSWDSSAEALLRVYQRVLA